MCSIKDKRRLKLSPYLYLSSRGLSKRKKERSVLFASIQFSTQKTRKNIAIFLDTKLIIIQFLSWKDSTVGKALCTQVNLLVMNYMTNKGDAKVHWLFKCHCFLPGNEKYGFVRLSTIPFSSSFLKSTLWISLIS